MNLNDNKRNSAHLCGLLLVILSLAAPAEAITDVSIAARKLVIRDKSAIGAKSSVVFVARDKEGLVEVGTGTDPGSVEAELQVFYPDGQPVAQFRVPVGSAPGVRGWRKLTGGFSFTNKATDPESLDTLTTVKSLLARSGKVLKVVARSAGDLDSNLRALGAPTGPVDTVLTIRNAGEEVRHCSRFESCRFKSSGGGLLANLVCKNAAPGPCPSSASRTRIEKAREPLHLYVVRTSELTSGEQVMVAGLQGLVARTSPAQIYLDPGAGGYRTWLEDLAATRGVTYEEVSDAWWLVDRFRDLLRGHLVWQAGDHSISVANSLAGIENALLVDASMEGRALARGLERIADLRSMNEGLILDNYASRLNPVVAFEQREEFTQQLRDYAVLSRAMVFFDGNSEFRNNLVETLAPDAAIYGWGDASIGEDVFVGASSDRGAFTIAADHAHNIAPLSGIPAHQQTQPNQPAASASPGKHYASFLMTDGDNIQWLLGTFATDARWYGSPLRGSFDMGYGMAPALAELAPSVLHWYYANAATGSGEDYFVVGPSGGGYLYPSRYPTAALDTHIERLAGWMSLADLSLIQILDAEARERLDLWDRFTAREEIEGLFYLEYADYADGRGRVNWSNGKPIIAPRGKLWTGLANSDAASIISLLNNARRDSSSVAGYSLINVAAWDQSFGLVQSVVASLSPDVEIVTPGELVQLMQDNVPHQIAFHHDFTGASFETSDLTLVGSTFWVRDEDALFQPNPQRLRLTNNGGGQVGSAWLSQPIDASESWSTAFRLQISHLVNGGADGMSFYLQPDGLAANPGIRGSFTGSALTVAVDTWDNGEGTSESLEVLLGDNRIFFNDLLDFTADPTPGSTGHVYRLELDYLSALRQLRIRLIDEGSAAALENWVEVDLASFGSMYAGFSAQTGGSAQNHDLRTWTLSAAAP
ncbi:MAG: GxGYxYP family putative glycoside hydrolase [Candidatus Binatia bacterium]|nr:GxGYxYP family putative glycoside hydrolase [Candidatus Binatia bacterium]MDG2010955.1 GxGYxYP family putative glycoside hydrolase [Candidatus Binatia bacterium]